MRAASTILLGLFALAAASAAGAACTSDAECADATLCNGTERCVAGVCQPSRPPVCGDDNPCTADSCDALLGCVHEPVANGTGCSDGRFCNGVETCQNGACAPGSPPPDGVSCTDGNPCNGLETCQAGTCAPGTPVGDGASCSDGQPCNGVETCQGGVCAAGTPLGEGAACGDSEPCNGVEQCHAGACMPGTPLGEGAACGDGNACNGAEVCHHGACTPGDAPNCNDFNPCTKDTCDPVTGCRHTAVGDGSSCGDANPCNGSETCRGGACTPGTPLGEGAACGDGNPCNGNETCHTGVCTPGTPLPDGASCGDANPCNGTETCRFGVCLGGGSSPPCEDGNPCTIDSCDAGSGCHHQVVADGTSCADGNPCNGEERCQASVCKPGTALVCDDHDPLTADSCAAGIGCVHTADRGVEGRHLSLQAAPHPAFHLDARGDDIEVSRSAADNALSDPVVNGATLRLVTSGPGSYDQTFSLPAKRWRYVGVGEVVTGYRYRDPLRSLSPIEFVLVKRGKLRAVGHGPLLPGLANDPEPVHAMLTLASTRYCTRFGGVVRFLSGRSYRAKDAPPASCPR